MLCFYLCFSSNNHFTTKYFVFVLYHKTITHIPRTSLYITQVIFFVEQQEWNVYIFFSFSLRQSFHVLLVSFVAHIEAWRKWHTFSEKENFVILIGISLKFVHKSPFDNEFSLVQTISLHHTRTNDDPVHWCPYVLPVLHSLWPCYVIWRHRSGSTLAQVMVCCTMALKPLPEPMLNSH